MMSAELASTKTKHELTDFVPQNSTLPRADDALEASHVRSLAQVTKPGKPKEAKVSDAASIFFKRLEKGYAVQSQGRKLAQTKPGKPKEAKVSDAAIISFKRLEKGYAVRP